MEINTQAVGPVGLPGSNEICKMAVYMDVWVIIISNVS